MIRVKLFNAGYISELQTQIDNWQNENPGFKILTVSGTDSSSRSGGRNLVTYIKYEDDSCSQEIDKILLKS